MFHRLALFCVLILVVGCGTNQQSFVASQGTNPNAGLTLIAPGDGPIANQTQANNVVLAKFLGVNSQGLSLQTTLPVVGAGESQPLIDVVIIPGGALVSGTRFENPAELEPADNLLLTLNAQYYAYFADPQPLFWMGHQTTLLFVRVEDGALFSLLAEWDPAIDGLRPIETRAERKSNLLYTHQGHIDVAEAIGGALATRTAVSFISLRGEGVRGRSDLPTNGETPRLKALVVGTSYDVAATEAHLDLATGFVENFEGAEVTRAEDTEANVLGLGENRLNRAVFETLILETASGLQPQDGFFLYLTGHGSVTGPWCKIGTQNVRYTKICEWLNKHVNACNVYFVSDACRSGGPGRLHDAMAAWPKHPGQRITGVTAVGDSNNLEAGDGTAAIQTGCLWKALEEALTEAGADGELTFTEVHDAMQFGGVPSADDYIQKLCEILDPVEPGTPAAAYKTIKSRALRGAVVSNHVPDESPPPPADPPPVQVNIVDDLDPPPPPDVLELLKTWLEALDRKDETGLGETLAPGYDYAQQNTSAAIGDLLEGDPTLEANLFTRYTPFGTLGLHGSVIGVNTRRTGPDSLNLTATTYYGFRIAPSGADLLIQKQAKLRWHERLSTPSQRVGLAVAIPQMTELLILDEPVSGLDALEQPELGGDFDLGRFLVAAGGDIEISLRAENLQAGATACVRLDGRSVELRNNGQGEYTGTILAPSRAGIFRIEVEISNQTDNGLAPTDPDFESLRNTVGRSVELIGIDGGQNSLQLTDFIVDWAEAANDSDELSTFYGQNFFYDQEDRDDIAAVDPSFNTSHSPSPIQEVSRNAGLSVVTFELESTITSAFGPIQQNAHRQVEMRLTDQPQSVPHAFAIDSQRDVSRTITGTIGLNPPPIPIGPTIQAFGLFETGGAPLTSLNPGQDFRVEIQVDGLFPFNPFGTEIGNVSLQLGGQEFGLLDQGGGIFSNTLTTPPLGTGLHAPTAIVENLRVQRVGNFGNSSSASAAQSLELEVR